MGSSEHAARAWSGARRRGAVPIILGLVVAVGAAVGLLATSGGTRAPVVPARIDLGGTATTARPPGSRGIVVVTPRHRVVVEGESEHDGGQGSGGGGSDTGS